jgi:N-acetyl-gamma-glutamyl-phosphate reductase
MINVAILGASGYIGAELVRIMSAHKNFNISVLSANRKTGQEYRTVFPHLRHLKLPKLISIGEVNFSNIDLVFCALPHSTSQPVIKALPKSLKIIDLSADFRLRDPKQYEKWYNATHMAQDLQKEFVYGLTEFYRQEIKSSRLVACTGCNAAAGMFPLVPLLLKRLVSHDNIIVDLATGVSGAGRSPKESMLHSEVSEGFSAYNVARHRHMAEFDQEFSKIAGKPVEVTFTPHLSPQNRGILATIYVSGSTELIYSELKSRYLQEPFIEVLPLGEVPSTRDVRGSNFCHIGVVQDRILGRTILFSALDNLTKGSAGQAVQNANLMFGLDETEGLNMAPLFP